MRTARANPARELSVTEIDREVGAAIAELRQLSAGAGPEKSNLLRDLESLKRQRFEAVRPKAFDRMLTSLK